jgi:hypothetical protein
MKIKTRTQSIVDNLPTDVSYSTVVLDETYTSEQVNQYTKTPSLVYDMTNQGQEIKSTSYRYVDVSSYKTSTESIYGTLLPVVYTVEAFSTVGSDNTETILFNDDNHRTIVILLHRTIDGTKGDARSQYSVHYILSGGIVRIYKATDEYYACDIIKQGELTNGSSIYPLKDATDGASLYTASKETSNGVDYCVIPPTRHTILPAAKNSDGTYICLYNKVFFFNGQSFELEAITVDDPEVFKVQNIALISSSTGELVAGGDHYKSTKKEVPINSIDVNRNNFSSYSYYVGYDDARDAVAIHKMYTQGIKTSSKENNTES